MSPLHVCIVKFLSWNLNNNYLGIIGKEVLRAAGKGKLGMSVSLYCSSYAEGADLL